MNQYEYVDGENMKNGLDGGLSEFKWLVAVATSKMNMRFCFHSHDLHGLRQQ